MLDRDALARIPQQAIALSWKQRLSMIARAAVGSMDMAPGSLGHTILSRINLGGLGLPPRRGTPQLLQAYSEMPWLRAVTGLIARSFASVEWRLYYAKRAGAQKAYRHLRAQKASAETRRLLRKQLQENAELNEITDHPLLAALDSANSFHTGYQMRKLLCTYVDLTGEAFLAKERNGAGMPMGFWPIPPNWILNTPSPQRPTFRVSYRGWQGELPDTDVLWFQDSDPLNPYGRGTGVGASLGDELESDEYAAKTMKQAFVNRALPEVLVMANGLDQSETMRMEQAWLAKNQGFFRGFKPMFLNREVKIERFEQDFRQLQFVQLRQFERDTVMQVFGISPEMLGILQASNRSTIDVADFVFQSKVIVPRLEFFRTILQERLVPEYDDRLIIDYENPVAEDREFMLKAATTFPYVLRVDEARAMLGQPPLDDKAEGAVFMVPALISPMTVLEPRPEPAPLAPFGGGGGGQPSPQGGTPKPPEPPSGPKAFAGRGATRKQIKGAYEDAAARIAARLEPAMRQAFIAAVEVVRGKVDIEALARAVDRNDVHAAHAALGVEQFALQLQGARQVVADAFSAGGYAASDLLADAGVSLSFRMTSPTAVAWVQARGASLVTEVTVETRQAIAAAIEDAFTYGRPPRDTAKELLNLIGLTERQVAAVDRFRDDLVTSGVNLADMERRTAKYAAAQLKRRATNIARTEIAAASNGGQQEMWEQARDAGLLDTEVTRRVWIVTQDDRLDTDVCEPMDDQERSLTDPFQTGTGESVMAPPAHPQCRCTMGIVVHAAEPTQRIMNGLAKLTEEVRRPRERVPVRDANGKTERIIDRMVER